MIGVECKWLWRLWQSALFADDWVEIWGEEKGSDSCDKWHLLNGHWTTHERENAETHEACMQSSIKMHANRFALSLLLMGMYNQRSCCHRTNKTEKRSAIFQDWNEDKLKGTNLYSVVIWRRNAPDTGCETPSLPAIKRLNRLKKVNKHRGAPEVGLRV